MELNELIEQIRGSQALPRGMDPARAITAVMCTLTAHLSRGEAVDLLETLPEEIRPLFRFCATHRSEPALAFDADQFFWFVSDHLGITAEQAAVLSRAIFKELQRWIPPKEFRDIEGQLPKDLKLVWRAA